MNPHDDAEFLACAVILSSGIAQLQTAHGYPDRSIVQQAEAVRTRARQARRFGRRRMDRQRTQTDQNRLHPHRQLPHPIPKPAAGPVNLTITRERRHTAGATRSVTRSARIDNVDT